MKIIIAGAGAIGFHLAELMSKENQDITLIDSDEEVLTHAGSHLDVLTKVLLRHCRQRTRGRGLLPTRREAAGTM